MKIVCVGRNYSAHIDELENERPKNPILFIKPDTSIIQKNQPFFIPHFTNEIHYEAEVIIKIDRMGKHIEPEFACKYYMQIQKLPCVRKRSHSKIYCFTGVGA